MLWSYVALLGGITYAPVRPLQASSSSRMIEVKETLHIRITALCRPQVKSTWKSGQFMPAARVRPLYDSPILAGLYDTLLLMRKKYAKGVLLLDEAGGHHII